MRQRVDADAEFADAFGLFEQFTIDAARAQHQRGGEAADAASNDDCFHARYSNSTRRSSTSPRLRGEGGIERACHPAYSAASGFVASALSSARVFGLPLILRSSKSFRSRTLLRKICSLPGRYCGGQATSAPYQAAARVVKDGSTRCGRASATRSARPAARIVLI